MKHWKKLLQWILIIFTVGFLVYILYTNFEELQQLDFSLSWEYFLLSYVFLFLHFLG